MFAFRSVILASYRIILEAYLVMTPDESSVPAGEASREADEEVLKHFWDLVSLETETRKASARALVDGIVRWVGAGVPSCNSSLAAALAAMAIAGIFVS